MSREELDKEREIDELFDALVAGGASVEELLNEWSDLEADEILRRFALPQNLRARGGPTPTEAVPV